jgi:protein FAM32A
MLARKKKKSKSSARDGEQDRLKELLFKEEEDANAASSGSSRDSPAIGGTGDRKTEAEKRFEEVQKRRVSLALVLTIPSILL